MSDRQDIAAPAILERARPDIRQLATQAKLPGLIFLALLVLGLLDPRIVSSGNLSNIVIHGADHGAADAGLRLVARFHRLARQRHIGDGDDQNRGYADPGIAAGPGVGLLIGGLNGFLIADTGINPLVAKFGMANVVTALASTVSGGFPVPGIPEAFTDA